VSFCFLAAIKEATLLNDTPSNDVQLHYGPETVEPNTMDQNFQNHDPKLIFPPLQLFSQVFVTAQKNPTHQVVLTSSIHTVLLHLSRKQCQLAESSQDSSDTWNSKSSSTISCFWKLELDNHYGP
jgi:hypothetical protein